MSHKSSKLNADSYQGCDIGFFEAIFGNFGEFSMVLAKNQNVKKPPIFLAIKWLFFLGVAFSLSLWLFNGKCWCFRPLLCSIMANLGRLWLFI